MQRIVSQSVLKKAEIMAYDKKRQQQGGLPYPSHAHISMAGMRSNTGLLIESGSHAFRPFVSTLRDYLHPT